MPILENARHEKFCQELATGKSISESYINAGYKPSRKNASRLRANEGIIARVAELQGAAARSTAITIQSICRELDEANAVAKERGQAAAMVSASALRAKLAGLMVDKVEVTDGNAFANCETHDEIAAAWARQIAEEKGYQMTPEEVSGFSKLVGQCLGAIDEYIAGCMAKPVPPTLSPHEVANLERRRLGLRRITNGSV